MSVCTCLWVCECVLGEKGGCGRLNFLSSLPSCFKNLWLSWKSRVSTQRASQVREQVWASAGGWKTLLAAFWVDGSSLRSCSLMSVALGSEGQEQMCRIQRWIVTGILPRGLVLATQVIPTFLFAQHLFPLPVLSSSVSWDHRPSSQTAWAWFQASAPVWPWSRCVTSLKPQFPHL